MRFLWSMAGYKISDMKRNVSYYMHLNERIEGRNKWQNYTEKMSGIEFPEYWQNTYSEGKKLRYAKKRWSGSVKSSVTSILLGRKRY